MLYINIHHLDFDKISKKKISKKKKYFSFWGLIVRLSCSSIVIDSP